MVDSAATWNGSNVLHVTTCPTVFEIWNLEFEIVEMIPGLTVDCTQVPDEIVRDLLVAIRKIV